MPDPENGVAGNPGFTEEVVMPEAGAGTVQGGMNAAVVVAGAAERNEIDADAATEDAPVARLSPDRETLRRIIEGALFAAGETITIERLCQLFDDHERPSPDETRQLLLEVAASFAGHGIELREVASGFRIQVRKELGPWVSRLWSEKAPRYSRALLETMALIAYKQPITRGEIEEIRGVAVSSDMVKTLLERDWIRIVGHRDVPGRPALYATTHEFLDYFDLKSLDELPTLSELRDLDRINPQLPFDAQSPAMTPAATSVDAGNESVLGGDSVAAGAQPSSVDGGGASGVAAARFEPEDDPEYQEDMQHIDQVLKRVEVSFRRKEDPVGPDPSPAGEAAGVPGQGAP